LIGKYFLAKAKRYLLGKLLDDFKKYLAASGYAPSAIDKPPGG